MIKVAISQRIDEIPDRQEIRDAVDQKLNNFVLKCGYCPYPVPNTLGQHIDDWLRVLQPSVILLSGGNDIGSFPCRDFTEEKLIKYADKHRLPLLGICRGMQMLGTFFGARLKNVNGHVRSQHKLCGKISQTVNSYHNQGLLSSPKDFSILAHSEDGEIEAIEHNNLPWQGWMWHPERNQEFDDCDIKRFKELLL
jgi:N5-(cytidine 5'-diphosphoramidyl)-L-glutamine hydrolase